MMYKKRAQRIMEQIPKSKIIRHSLEADYVGNGKRNWMQYKGCGVLILTKEDLIFAFLKPGRKKTIPVKTINKVEITKWFSKRTKGKPVLKLNYINRKGKNAIIGFIIPEVQEWANNIQNEIIS
ncbi:MAG: hypothetical protein EU548_09905 [Promethearchaeota archaeon]|nr:MAG: hypothetical protein EU548_09905 [Candidatus Lokiarchaeota archaeon]